MNTVYDSEKIFILLEDFYKFTKVPITILDDLGVRAVHYPKELPGFCVFLKTETKALNDCIVCKRNSISRARKKDDVHIYRCPAGLTMAILQINVNKIIAGYITLGPVVPDSGFKNGWRHILSYCRDFGLINREELRRSYLKLPGLSMELMSSAGRIIKAIASHLYPSKMLRFTEGSLEFNLDCFIGEHIKEPLSSAELCKKFGLSRTKLYYLSKQIYGMGITDRIIELKIQTACNLIMTTDMQNKEISYEVGINDYNYFSKLFRKRIGLSPRQYRETIKKLEQ